MEKEKVIEIVNKMSDTRFEIFCEMLEMKSQNEIAESLGEKLKAVKYHIGRIYKDFDIVECNSSSQSKRLLFSRKLMVFSPRPELGISALVN